MPSSWDWKIDALFWPLIREFDADFWSHFQRNLRSLEMENAAAYESFIEEVVEANVGTTSFTKDKYQEYFIESNQRLASWAWPRSIELGEKIAALTAPYGTPSAMAVTFYEVGQVLPQRTVDLLGLTNSPKQVVHLELDGVPDSIQLLVYSRAGRYRLEYQESFAKRIDAQITHLFVENDQTANLLRYAWGLGSSISPVKVELTVPGGRVTAMLESYSSKWIRELSPFALTQFGNLFFSTSTFTDNNPIVIVCGDTVGDFCFAYSRQKITETTHWFPLSPSNITTSLGEMMVEVMSEVLTENAGSPHEVRKVFVTSYSEDSQNLQPLVDALNSLLASSPPFLYTAQSVSVEACEVRKLPTERDVYLLDREVSDVTTYEPFVNEEMASTVKVLTPTIGRLEGCRWQVDIEDDLRRLPSRNIVNSLLTAGDSHVKFALRSSRSGISIDSHGTGFTLSGTSVSQSLVKVKPRFPPIEEIYREVFQTQKTKIQPSDKGKFSLRMVELWGDLESISSDLRSPSLGLLWRNWANKLRSQKIPGLTFDGRRYLRLIDVVHSTGLHVDEAREVIDSYLLRGILSRGLVLSCTQCDNTSFYRSNEFSELFECRRCRRSSPIMRQNWKGTREPQWFYGMDEMVFQALNNNAAVPLLALAELAKGFRSFDWMPEQVLVNQTGDQVEIDIFAIRNGELILGEAKLANRLEMSDKKLASLGSLFNLIRLEVFVMATSENNWTEDSRAKIFKYLPPETRVEWLTKLRYHD